MQFCVPFLFLGSTLKILIKLLLNPPSDYIYPINFSFIIILTTRGLKYYLHRFSKLRRDHKYGGAPHKPILLLSIISCFENGYFKSNKIYLTPDLVGEFKSIWTELVKSEKHHCLLSLPFFYMKSEPFWHLQPNIGYELLLKSKNKVRGLNNLKAAVAYAQIDIELFRLLENNDERTTLKLALINKYFPNTSSNFSLKNTYLDTIKHEILNEPSEQYKLKLFELQTRLHKDEFQEEKYLRSHLFKQQIQLSYKNTCSISRLRIDAISNISLIDACHIIPFSQSYDDTIANGFALNPTLHRAFDRGLVTIDENYCVLISENFREHDKCGHSIRQYQGVQIIIPERENHIPKIENFKWHRQHIFQK